MKRTQGTPGTAVYALSCVQGLGKAHWSCQDRGRETCTHTLKVRVAKAVVSPAVRYRCESWTIKKAESQRIDFFKLWCWRRLLRVPWTARRWNQSTLKEINPKYSLEGLMLKLKLQYFGHLMQRAYSLQKTLMLGKTKGRQQRMRYLGGITDSIRHESEQIRRNSEGQRSLVCCSPWGR